MENQELSWVRWPPGGAIYHIDGVIQTIFSCRRHHRLNLGILGEHKNIMPQYAIYHWVVSSSQVHLMDFPSCLVSLRIGVLLATCADLSYTALTNFPNCYWELWFILYLPKWQVLTRSCQRSGSAPRGQLIQDRTVHFPSPAEIRPSAISSLLSLADRPTIIASFSRHFRGSLCKTFLF